MMMTINIFCLKVIVKGSFWKILGGYGGFD